MSHLTGCTGCVARLVALVSLLRSGSACPRTEGQVGKQVRIVQGMRTSSRGRGTRCSCPPCLTSTFAYGSHDFCRGKLRSG